MIGIKKVSLSHQSKKTDIKTKADTDTDTDTEKN